MNGEEWVLFFLDGKEIGGYTVRGTFEGEQEATAELLAAGHGVPVSEIEVRRVCKRRATA